MADLSQTAANVALRSNSLPSVGVAGEAITQGMPVYLSGGKWYQCDANDGAAKAVAGGIAVLPATTDGFFAYLSTGAKINLGATLVVGTTYVVSATKGAIAPIADLATGHYATTLGVATAANELTININVSGVQVPA